MTEIPFKIETLEDSSYPASVEIPVQGYAGPVIASRSGFGSSHSVPYSEYPRGSHPHPLNFSVSASSVNGAQMDDSSSHAGDTSVTRFPLENKYAGNDYNSLRPGRQGVPLSISSNALYHGQAYPGSNQSQSGWPILQPGNPPPIQQYNVHGTHYGGELGADLELELLSSPSPVWVDDYPSVQQSHLSVDAPLIRDMSPGDQGSPSNNISSMSWTPGVSYGQHVASRGYPLSVDIPRSPVAPGLLSASTYSVSSFAVSPSGSPLLSPGYASSASEYISPLSSKPPDSPMEVKREQNHPLYIACTPQTSGNAVSHSRHLSIDAHVSSPPVASSSSISSNPIAIISGMQAISISQEEYADQHTPTTEPQTTVIRQTVTTLATESAAAKRRTRPQRFICPYCQKHLTAKHNLQRHIDAHLGIKRYSCLCGTYFTTKGDRQRHIKGSKTGSRCGVPRNSASVSAPP